MTELEIKHLLAAVMAYDNRKPGQAAVLAWMEASARARWTFVEALEAVHQHYAESTEFLMPAHITRIIRNGRRADGERLALPPATPASDEVRSSAMAAAREVFSRLPHLAGAGRLPQEIHPLGPKVARIQRQAAAAEEAIAALDQLANRKPDSTPEGA